MDVQQINSVLGFHIRQTPEIGVQGLNAMIPNPPPRCDSFRIIRHGRPAFDDDQLAVCFSINENATSVPDFGVGRTRRIAVRAVARPLPERRYAWSGLPNERFESVGWPEAGSCWTL